MSNCNTGDETAWPRTDGHFERGLTKRELLSAMAMQGILSTLGGLGYIENLAERVASAAVEHADALLEKLENG